MKMAKASEQDLEAANAVARILEELEKGYMPSNGEDDETEFFDRDDREQCQRALAAILDAADRGSLFRVTFGMLVLLDPRNKIVDPAADTLELHPEHKTNAQEIIRLQKEVTVRTEMYHMVVNSVCAALERAGVDAVDDPGEAIDVLVAGLKSELAVSQEREKAMRAAISKLARSYRNDGSADGAAVASDIAALLEES